ncbi:hypothetical protein [Niallia endozanthoxylica]|uniref:Uncharacterized protein n=1 Tax=Niallia endozanthoxylica TaxID=2036016 RepID=A0A5J5HZL6_9BACI|nr:hypothetical protein [Niallia endozanthoxylica]KAA9027525.1 hypothetical protein F4V44_05875 [Niallia endozanthoxylica]
MIKIILFLTFMLLLQTGNIAEGTKELSLHAVAAEEKEEKQNFKDIHVIKKNGQYVITGNSKVRKGVFYYSVEDGHRVLIPETKIRVNNLYWTSFKLSITIPTNFVPDNGVLTLNLYEKNRSKEVTDPFPIVLESFKE